MIKINSQEQCTERTLSNPCTAILPYCFGTKAKQEDISLIQMQEVTGLSVGAITSIAGVLASVQQNFNTPMLNLGKEFVADIVLAIEKLDWPALAHLGHVLRLSA